MKSEVKYGAVRVYYIMYLSLQSTGVQMGTKPKSKAYTNFEGSSMRQAGDVVYSNVPTGHAGLLRPECSFHLELSACSFRMITSCFYNYVFLHHDVQKGKGVSDNIMPIH